MKRLWIALWFIPLLAFAEPNTLTVYVDGLSCPFCAGTIEKQIKKIREIDSVELSLKTGKVDVVVKEGAKVEIADIEHAIVKAGFSVRKGTSE